MLSALRRPLRARAALHSPWRQPCRGYRSDFRNLGWLEQKEGEQNKEDPAKKAQATNDFFAANQLKFSPSDAKSGEPEQSRSRQKQSGRTQDDRRHSQTKDAARKRASAPNRWSDHHVDAAREWMANDDAVAHMQADEQWNELRALSLDDGAIDSAASEDEWSETQTARQRTLNTVHRMNQCGSYEDAYHVYARQRDRAIKHGLAPYDAAFWATFVFRSMLSFPSRGKGKGRENPPMPFLFTRMLIVMLHDMFEWKATRSASYTRCFDAIAKCAKQSSDPNELMELRELLIAAHGLLLREPEDERGLHNIVNTTALMNAYSFVGLRSSTLEMWMKMILSNVSIEPATVCVVLDACGRSNRLSDARKVFSYVTGERKRMHRLMTNNVWDAYVECLARCGQVREAIDVALFRMTPALKERAAAMAVDAKHELYTAQYGEPDEHDDLLPKLKTLRMLVTFAAQKTQARRFERDPTILSDLLRELKQSFPHYLDQIIDGSNDERTDDLIRREIRYNV